MDSSTFVPIINTNRLTLRPISVADTDLVFELRSNAMISGLIDRPVITRREEVVDFIRQLEHGRLHQSLCYWAIVTQQGGDGIGIICLWNYNEARTKAEVGYELLPQYWGHGYMNEALEAVIHFAFKQAGFTLLEAWTNTGNVASARVLTQVGFMPVEKDALSEMTTMTAYELVNRNPF